MTFPDRRTANILLTILLFAVVLIIIYLARRILFIFEHTRAGSCREVMVCAKSSSPLKRPVPINWQLSARWHANSSRSRHGALLALLTHVAAQ